MSVFIPLSTFAELYGKAGDLLTPKGFEHFVTELEKNGRSLAADAGFSEDDFTAFLLRTKSTPEVIIYHGWVEQDKSLRRMLLNERPFEAFRDRHGHLNHQMASGYRAFISPFLANRLLQQKDDSYESLALFLSFVPLLDRDHRSTVETALFSKIRKDVQQYTEQAETVEKEQELMNLIQPLCSDSIIACLNALSRSAYATKLEYVDRILETLRMKACTRRFGNWVIKRMERVQLNDEHQERIVELRQQLRTGNLIVRNRPMRAFRLNRASLLPALSILILGGAILYLFYFWTSGNNEGEEIPTTTSAFSQFTVEERKTIDSLLREVEVGRAPENVAIDQTLPIPQGGRAITIRKPFENERLEEIYKDWYKDAKLKENYSLDSCARNHSSFSLPEKTLHADLKRGGVQAVIRNESEYDVIFYIAENRTFGAIHVFFLGKAETKTVTMDRNNVLFMVAGNHLQPFKTPKNVRTKEEVPSKRLTQHFCDTDMNFWESMNTAYVVRATCPDRAKFMITGVKNGFLHFVDLHSALEAY